MRNPTTIDTINLILNGIQMPGLAAEAATTNFLTTEMTKATKAYLRAKKALDRAEGRIHSLRERMRDHLDTCQF